MKALGWEWRDTEGLRGKSQSDSVQSEGVCPLIALLRIELLLPGVGEESRGIPGKPWNSGKAVEFWPRACCTIASRTLPGARSHAESAWTGLPVPKGFFHEEGTALADRVLCKANSEKVSFFIWNFYLYTHQSLGNDCPLPFVYLHRRIVAAMPGRSKIKKQLL